SLSATAKKVDPTTAKTIAINFYYERVNQYHDTEIDEIIIKNSFNEYFETTQVFYIFNFEPRGFVIVSANDAVVPIPAYSFDGTIEKNNQPDNYKAWVNQYSQQIKYAFDNNLQADETISFEWDRLSTSIINELKLFSKEKDIEPLLTTTWNQGTYYNEMCPADPAGPGGHCYAGCVPTAMGQVVNYFRFPLQGSGSYSYQCPPYGTLSADFENTNYLWNNMPLALSSSNLATAELLYHLGVSCDLVYGPNGSGMYNHKAAYSLRTFFNYSPETEYVYRDSTSINWDSLLVAHLNQKIPMYYAGWSVPNVNGHAFVCDGYQGSNFFHFNWGWGGSYDGYFYTDNLSPGGSNFNLAQEVIINCFPDTVNFQYPYYCTGNDTLISTSGTIDDGSGPVYNYLNNTDCSWLIAPNDSVENITIDFLKFDTETNDILTVYDGENISSPVLGSFSGSSIPESITSSGDKIFITFISNENTNTEGWLLSYESQIPVYCHGMTQLTNPEGTFSDGSGPRDYHNSSICMWQIIPDNPDEIILFFDEFETETDNDIFNVYDGTTLIAELSGNELPNPISAFSGSMFITFTSNTSITAPGWKVHYITSYVGIEKQNKKTDINIFPNPVNKELTIILDNKKSQLLTLEVISINGTIKNKYQLGAFEGKLTKKINISSPPGVYILKIIGDDFVDYRKIIVSD
ncbi:MAG: C10 family peptidase, partial [Bacteroidales bacterium]|nr:C10 family peptidase [Bacteroidales bacterium]